jgi:hypothetical protein
VVPDVGGVPESVVAGALLLVQQRLLCGGQALELLVGVGRVVDVRVDVADPIAVGLPDGWG